MTSPVEAVTVTCPGCGKVYEDWFRPSVNLMLDNFDETYLDEASSATCPGCGLNVRFENLIVDGEGRFMGPR